MNHHHHYGSARRQSYLQSLKFAVGGILGRGHWGQWIYPMILYTVAAQDDSIH